MIQFLKQILSNPDNITPSAKRHHAFWSFSVAAIIGLGTFILMWFEKEINETLVLGLLYGFLSFSAACLGITSYDYKQYLNTNKTSPETINPPTSENGQVG